MKLLKLDNGYVLEWETKRVKLPKFHGYDREDKDDLFDPRGVEIFTKLDDALKRMKTLLG